MRLAAGLKRVNTCALRHFRRTRESLLFTLGRVTEADSAAALHLEGPQGAKYVTIDHDVLVLGAGLAGMRAALEAARQGADVAIASKVHPIRSHSSAAQGGINAALGEGDTWESHAFDTIKGSDYLADQDAVEVMCREAPADIVEFEHMGVIFYRNEDGKLGTRAFGGASQARTYFVGDITGQALLVTLYDQILQAGVNVYEEWFATTLYVENGACRGLVALEMITGELHLVRAKAVIDAAGGGGGGRGRTPAPPLCTTRAGRA